MSPYLLLFLVLSRCAENEEMDNFIDNNAKMKFQNAKSSDTPISEESKTSSKSSEMSKENDSDEKISNNSKNQENIGYKKLVEDSESEINSEKEHTNIEYGNNNKDSQDLERRPLVDPQQNEEDYMPRNNSPAEDSSKYVLSEKHSPNILRSESSSKNSSGQTSPISSSEYEVLSPENNNENQQIQTDDNSRKIKNKDLKNSNDNKRSQINSQIPNKNQQPYYKKRASNNTKNMRDIKPKDVVVADDEYSSDKYSDSNDIETNKKRLKNLLYKFIENGKKYCKKVKNNNEISQALKQLGVLDNIQNKQSSQGPLKTRGIFDIFWPNTDKPVKIEEPVTIMKVIIRFRP